jgi:hypothetical protein
VWLGILQELELGPKDTPALSQAGFFDFAAFLAGAFVRVAAAPDDFFCVPMLARKLARGAILKLHLYEWP